MRQKVWRGKGNKKRKIKEEYHKMPLVDKPTGNGVILDPDKGYLVLTF